MDSTEKLAVKLRSLMIKPGSSSKWEDTDEFFRRGWRQLAVWIQEHYQKRPRVAVDLDDLEETLHIAADVMERNAATLDQLARAASEATPKKMKKLKPDALVELLTSDKPIAKKGRKPNWLKK